MSTWITPFGKAKEVSPGVARVTFSTKQHSVAPQLIRARVALAGLFNITGNRMTQPSIVGQAPDSSWITWEARKLRDNEPDTPR